MSDDLGLGKIINGPQQRDAIHIAVAPVTAATVFRPGQHAAIGSDGRARDTGKLVGIVDPFLRDDVQAGQQFWLFLYPQTVTGMRHHWRHPSFSCDDAAADETQAAERWVRNYATRANSCEKTPELAYQRFMDDVRRGNIYFHGTDCHSLYDVEDSDELFRNLSILLGHEVHGGSFEYSCSCKP